VSISQLNSGLIDISQLYSDFAEPYQLWECQLAILHCAGHPDQVGPWANNSQQEHSVAQRLSERKRKYPGFDPQNTGQQ